MSRNDLVNWISYWLGCSAEQTKLINQKLREMTMAELKEIDRRAADRTQSATVLAELLTPVNTQQLASV